ncbi:alpha-L-rhamnosidase [Streptomyces justiciae]|uniref:alpha-L-rhamnosidase n=1 Tax=Streptomyces justiciae TaxID=2780140 RepID=UPI001880147C|nr:alpha-L-rhamnosidase [Streptomyces justiciae]MBE8476130.1 family 78 glycoside hydrolase catalytic domain [Streptomyces justiciae]
MPLNRSATRRQVVGSAAAAVVLGMMTPARSAALSGAPSATAAGTGDGWTAQWIGRDTPPVAPELGRQNPAPLLRRKFALGKRVVRAEFSIVGLGYYEAWINGHRVGDQVLDPPPSAYDQTAYSRTFDVTKALRSGDNALAVTLGRGYLSTPATTPTTIFGLSKAPWTQEPRLLAQLDIVFSDGTRRRVVSDDTWKITDGPTLDALYFGEHYDARRARPGWTNADYDDSGWEDAQVQPAPTKQVVPADMPPVKVTDTFDPVGSTKLKTGTQVYDFGRTTAGWARIKVSGTAGTTVTLIYGEQLNDDGTVFQSGMLGPADVSHLDSYTLGGKGVQTWEPSFTRHGFRYVEVSTSAPLTSFEIEARVAHTAVASTGRFDCANPVLNRINANQRASLLDNMWGIPSDTPWRDRQGWTADAYLYLDSAALNFDVEGLYRQWLRTFRESQRADGALPVIAPNPGGFPLWNDPSWSGTLISSTWTHYQHYGATGVLSDNYPAMARWLDLMRTTIAGTNGLYTGFSFGDWSPPGAENATTVALRPPEGSLLTANADLYHEARLLALIARELGHSGDAARFDTMADALAEKFNEKFLDADTGVYHTPVEAGYRQTSNLVALAYGLVPDEHRDKVFANLVKDITDRGDHLNTGAIGTKLLLPVLTENGRADLAYKIAAQTDYPSWGYWVKQGATTSWETWSMTKKDFSMNHPFLGTVDDWFYQHLAGIQAAAPGYAKLLVAPVVPDDLRYASAQVTTPRGEVSSCWRRQNGRLTLTVTVPAGTPAEVRVPLTDGARGVTAGRGATRAERKDDYVAYNVGAGTHVFHVS